jgi:arylsulfatase A-like enzyme
LVSALRDAKKEQETHRILTFPRAVRDGDWKLVMQDAAGPELFHVGQDRNEKKSLAAVWPERVEQLKQLHSELFLNERELK